MEHSQNVLLVESTNERTSRMHQIIIGYFSRNIFILKNFDDPEIIFRLRLLQLGQQSK